MASQSFDMYGEQAVDTEVVKVVRFVCKQGQQSALADALQTIKQTAIKTKKCLQYNILLSGDDVVIEIEKWATQADHDAWAEASMGPLKDTLGIPSMIESRTADFTTYHKSE